MPKKTPKILPSDDNNEEDDMKNNGNNGNPVFKNLGINKAKTFKNRKKEAKNNPSGE